MDKEGAFLWNWKINDYFVKYIPEGQDHYDTIWLRTVEDTDMATVVKFVMDFFGEALGKT